MSNFVISESKARRPLFATWLEEFQGHKISKYVLSALAWNRTGMASSMLLTSRLPIEIKIREALTSCLNLISPERLGQEGWISRPSNLIRYPHLFCLHSSFKPPVKSLSRNTDPILHRIALNRNACS